LSQTINTKDCRVQYIFLAANKQRPMKNDKFIYKKTHYSRNLAARHPASILPLYSLIIIVCLFHNNKRKIINQRVAAYLGEKVYIYVLLSSSAANQAASIVAL